MSAAKGFKVKCRQCKFTRSCPSSSAAQRAIDDHKAETSRPSLGVKGHEAYVEKPKTPGGSRSLKNKHK